MRIKIIIITVIIIFTITITITTTRDGRLRPGVQVLAINEHPLEPSMSSEELTELLQKNNDAVELILKRSSPLSGEEGTVTEVVVPD